MRGLLRERRSSERIHWVATAKVVSPADGVVAAFQTFQLGEGGCSLLGAESLQVGRVMTLELALNDETILPVGQVVYEKTHEGGILTGVRFLSMTPDEQSLLDRFISERVEEGVLAAS